MRSFTKRAVILLRPEWEPEIKRLKQEKFFEGTQADVFRYLIQLGLEAAHEEKEDTQKPTTGTGCGP